MFKCEFCDKELSTKSILKSHQLKTRYCLDRQKLLNIDVNIINEQCQYCSKNFTHKHKRDLHQLNCSEKDKKELISHYENKLILLKIELDNQSKKYDDALLTIKERDIQISLLKSEKADIYSGLFNKDHDFILNQNTKLSERQVITNTNTIKGKYVTMNSLNLSRERLDSIKDTYTLKHYERGGIGQADWVIDNILKDDSGNLVYKCTDKNRKNFTYRNESGETVNDIEAKKLKEAILPIMTTKLKEYKKIKYNELADVDDDDNSLLDKCNNLYIENREIGIKFDKRLIEKTYEK